MRRSSLSKVTVLEIAVRVNSGWCIMLWVRLSLCVMYIELLCYVYT